MIEKRDGWLAAKVGQEVVMMSVESGIYIGLNAVGAQVWAMIGAAKPVPEICRDLAEEYEVTAETCRADVEAFLAELEKRGAITRRN
jgi:hypothetical protein